MAKAKTKAKAVKKVQKKAPAPVAKKAVKKAPAPKRVKPEEQFDRAGAAAGQRALDRMVPPTPAPVECDHLPAYKHLALHPSKIVTCACGVEFRGAMAGVPLFPKAEAVHLNPESAKAVESMVGPTSTPTSALIAAVAPALDSLEAITTTVNEAIPETSAGEVRRARKPRGPNKPKAPKPPYETPSIRGPFTQAEVDREKARILQEQGITPPEFNGVDAAIATAADALGVSLEDLYPVEPAVDWTTVPVLQFSDLPTLLTQRRDATLKKKEAEATLDKLNEEIEGYLEMAEIKHLQVNDFRVTRVTTKGKRTLKVEKLVENGCPIEIINESYVTGKSSTHILVTEEREEGK